MASRTKPPQKLDEASVAAYKVHSTAAVLTALIRWGGLCFVVYYGVYKPVEALAGNETIANIAVSLLANIRINRALAWVLAGGSMAYGLRERKLRQRTIGRLEGQIRRLETKEDRRRSSSKLTRQGRTNPGDEL